MAANEWIKIPDAIPKLVNIAADLREKWLYDIYIMGRDAIESGEMGGPFAYIVPNNQWDLYETGKFLSVLRKGGIEVHKATRAFKANGKNYAKGAHVIFTGQAFRPHLMDMLEPQIYPELKDANGKPKVPYDLAGWTLPLQMGIEVDRIEKPFKVRTEIIESLENLKQLQNKISSNNFFTIYEKMFKSI